MSPGLARDIIMIGAPPAAGAVIGWALSELVLWSLRRAPGSRSRLERAFRSRLGTDAFRAWLAAAVSRLSARALDSRVGKKLGATGAPPARAADPGQLVHALLGSRLSILVVRGVVTRAVTALARIPASDLAARLHFRRFISERILPLLAAREARESLAGAIEAMLRGVGEPARGDPLSAAAVSLLPRGVDGLMGWLRSDAMQAELASRGRALLAGVLDKLHVVQRFLLSAGQFDSRLDEKMPEIVADALASAEELARAPENQERFLLAMGEALRSRGTAARGDVRPPRSPTPAAAISTALLSRLEEPGERDRVAGLIEDALARPGESAGALAFRLFGVTESAAIEGLSNRILGFLGREGTASALTRAAADASAGLAREGSGGRLADLLGADPGTKAALDALLADKALSLLESGLPEILETVEGMVEGAVRANRTRVDAVGALIGFCAGLVPLGLRALGV